jgi:four helix bundle protein
MHWSELEVWKKSHGVVLEVYRVTAVFPADERDGLTSQLRRAAASVPANIVEGNSRSTTKDYMHFLYQARGSLEEVRYFLLLGRDLKLLQDAAYLELEKTCEDASKMLNGLLSSLKRKIAPYPVPHTP